METIDLEMKLKDLDIEKFDRKEEETIHVGKLILSKELGDIRFNLRIEGKSSEVKAFLKDRNLAIVGDEVSIKFGKPSQKKLDEE